LTRVKDQLVSKRSCWQLFFHHKSPFWNSGVEIGDNNVLREYCTIHRGTKEGTNTRIGSNNLFMVGAHLGHNTRLGDSVILANNVLLGGYVEIQNSVFVGGGSVVHQFTRMGAVSLMQGLSGIGKDVPHLSAKKSNFSAAAEKFHFRLKFKPGIAQATSLGFAWGSIPIIPT
jgi:acyl-ACP--UDP-N-acetylglucosamine O-acyltransferase